MEHLKPPEALILSAATNKAEAWRRWKMSWELYKVASGLDKKDEKIQVATLLHVLGKECVEIYSNFVWENEGDRDKIAVVEENFKAHCAPLTSLHFNRHLFIKRKQQEGEIVDDFCSALKIKHWLRIVISATRKNLDYVYVSSRPQGSEFEGDTYGTRTEPGENINSGSHCRDK